MLKLSTIAVLLLGSLDSVFAQTRTTTSTSNTKALPLKMKKCDTWKNWPYTSSLNNNFPISGGVFRNSNVQDCQRKCDENPECNSFWFSKPYHPNN